MVNTETFCPFERIIALFKKTAISIGATELSVDFGLYGTRSYDVSTDEGKKLYFDGKFPVEQRVAFMKLKTFSGKVFFDRHEYVFNVYHDLWKIAEIMSEFEKQKPVKNTVGVTPSFYKEALQIVTSRKDFSPAASPKNESNDFTPFYNYVVFNTDLDPSRPIEIHGPGVVHSLCNIGSVKTTLGSVKIFSDDPSIQVPDYKEPMIQPEDVTYKVLKPATFIRYRDVVKPLLFTQKKTVLGGITVGFDVLLKLYMMGCYFEFARAHDINVPFEKHDSGYVIELRRVGEDLLLKEEDLIFFYDQVKITGFISELFRDLRATSSGIELLTKHQSNGEELKQGVYIALISDSPNQACFVLTMAGYISYLLDGSLTSFIGALNSLNSVGGIIAAWNPNYDKYVCVGYSDGYWNGSVQRVTTLNGYGSVRAELERLSEIPDEEGFAVVGFDDETNRFAGEPDHYVLTYISNKRLLLVFDPYAFSSDLAVGKDITDIFTSCNPDERVFYHMKNSSVSSWLNTKSEGVA